MANDVTSKPNHHWSQTEEMNRGLLIIECLTVTCRWAENQNWELVQTKLLCCCPLYQQQQTSAYIWVA